MLRDGDGNVRAAVICWGIVLSAFIILRIPREVLLGCLIVAGATVGLAATAVDLAPERAAASPRPPEMTAVRGQTASSLRGLRYNPVERVRSR
ncbi:MAG TPA: hypothetical protein VJV39_11840 [Dongiaceae bacterium]|nr:hypothetical protein [Dongiaceae bacterium]